jgi:CubicO group peptidase (beta-lactamase class C family)
VGDVLADVVALRAEYRPVTLAQLLSHSSGVPEIDGNTELAINSSGTSTAQQRRDIVAATLAFPPQSAPGTAFAYSNVNFVAAGLMLEVVTGQSWETLVTERLFGPLGMTHAGFGSPGTAGQVDAPWGHGPIARDPGPVNGRPETSKSDCCGAA